MEHHKKIMFIHKKGTKNNYAYQTFNINIIEIFPIYIINVILK